MKTAPQKSKIFQVSVPATKDNVLSVIKDLEDYVSVLTKELKALEEYAEENKELMSTLWDEDSTPGVYVDREKAFNAAETYKDFVSMIEFPKVFERISKVKDEICYYKSRVQREKEEYERSQFVLKTYPVRAFEQKYEGDYASYFVTLQKDSGWKITKSETYTPDGDFTEEEAYEYLEAEKGEYKVLYENGVLKASSKKAGAEFIKVAVFDSEDSI